MSQPEQTDADRIREAFAAICNSLAFKCAVLVRGAGWAVDDLEVVLGGDTAKDIAFAVHTGAITAAEVGQLAQRHGHMVPQKLVGMAVVIDTAMPAMATVRVKIEAVRERRRQAPHPEG